MTRRKQSYKWGQWLLFFTVALVSLYLVTLGLLTPTTKEAREKSTEQLRETIARISAENMESALEPDSQSVVLTKQSIEETRARWQTLFAQWQARMQDKIFYEDWVNCCEIAWDVCLKYESLSELSSVLMHRPELEVPTLSLLIQVSWATVPLT